jgi:hypothetical protein
MAATIRGGISDTVNTLNKLRNNTTIPEEQIKLQKLIDLYFFLWGQVIYDQIDSSTPIYKQAIKTLKEAEKAAADALAGIEQVSEVIKIAAKAAQVIGSIIGIAVGIAL